MIGECRKKYPLKAKSCFDGIKEMFVEKPQAEELWSNSCLDYDFPRRICTSEPCAEDSEKIGSLPNGNEIPNMIRQNQKEKPTFY